MARSSLSASIARLIRWAMAFPSVPKGSIGGIAGAGKRRRNQPLTT
jgi:hypothetical protein